MRLFDYIYTAYLSVTDYMRKLFTKTQSTNQRQGLTEEEVNLYIFPKDY